jgi:hypothetical protein
MRASTGGRADVHASDSATDDRPQTGAGGVPADDVARNVGTTRFSVAGPGWAALRPDLPPEVIDLLAPPVLVSAAVAFPATPRRAPGRHRRS